MCRDLLVHAWQKFIQLLVLRRTKPARQPLSVQAKGSAEIIAVKNLATGGTSAVRIGSTGGHTSDANQVDDQSVEYSIRGSSPQNEEGVLKVCSVLIEKLNNDGASWAQPTRPEGQEGGVDCVTTAGSGELNIQVTRAMQDKKVWQSLSKAGVVNQNTTIQRAADDLRGAIKKKETIPVKQRGDIVLALDANLTGGFAFTSVVESFESRYRAEVKALGFKGIWLVGPVASLTIRLDDDEVIKDSE